MGGTLYLERKECENYTHLLRNRAGRRERTETFNTLREKKKKKPLEPKRCGHLGEQVGGFPQNGTVSYRTIQQSRSLIFTRRS